LIDKNNDGTLSREEILEVYTTVFNDPIKAKIVCDELFDSADYNNSGKIDFTGKLIDYLLLLRIFNSILELREITQ
jgi:Ca2+-binding EF-hand superfamily protein